MRKISHWMSRRWGDVAGIGRNGRPLWWLAFALLVLPTVITCSSGSKGGTASVALLVKMPSSNQQQASVPSVVGFLATMWNWITGVDSAWAQTTTPICINGNCRLLIDVSAPDLPPQYTTIQNVSAGTVTVNLLVPYGSARIFRVTLEQDTGSGFVPVYAGCHSGVELSGSASVNVPIELATTTTCLRVIVLGGGSQLNQPLSGIRVIRHANVSPYGPLDDKVSDANGIVEFGDINPTGIPNEIPEHTTISFVLKRTQSPAAQAAVSLIDIPITGDVKFNVALNNFDDLNLDLPVRAQVTGQFPQELFCPSDAPESDCPAVLSGSGGSVQQTFAPFIINQGDPGLSSIGPMDIYQLQNDGTFSLGATFSNVGVLNCFSASPEPSGSGTKNLSLRDYISADYFYNSANLSGLLFFHEQATLHKGSVIKQPLLGFQDGDIVDYCPSPNEQLTKISFVDAGNTGRQFSTFFPGVGQPRPSVTVATNNISVTLVSRPAIDQIQWEVSGNATLSNVISVEQRWTTTIQIPSGSPSVLQLRRYTLVQPGATSAVLPTLPDDLSDLNTLPDGTVDQISTSVVYNGVTPALTWDNLWRRLFGGAGAYVDIEFDGTTTDTHEISYELVQPPPPAP